MEKSKWIEEEEVIDLWAVAKVLFDNKWIISIVSVVMGVLAFAWVTFLVQPQYQSSITMYVNNRASKDAVTTMSQADLNASVHLVDTYSAIITNSSVLKDVMEEAGVELEAEVLKRKMDVRSVNNTEVFEVLVTNTDPQTAAALADAVAKIAPKRIGDIVEGSSIKVISNAEVPTKPISPNRMKTTLMGVMLGFLLSAGLAVVCFLLDTTVKSEEDLARWNYPILCVIPEMAQAQREMDAYGKQ